MFQNESHVPAALLKNKKGGRKEKRKRKEESIDYLIDKTRHVLRSF